MPIPESIPESLESERLLIRVPTLDDVPVIYEAVRESLPELKPWMVWATDDYSLEGCRENTQGAIDAFREKTSLRFHFHDKETGEFIGNSGFHAIDWSIPKLEVGYWCRSSKTGHGYIQEGVRALSDFALETLGVERVELRCDELNKASQEVASRAGFTLDGVLWNDSRTPDGDLRSTRVYSRLKSLRYVV